MPILKLSLDIPQEEIRGLLCCALEGGSNYWYKNLDWESDDESITAHDLVIESDGGIEWSWPYVAPFKKGCRLTLQVKEDFDDPKDMVKRYVIDENRIAYGMNVFTKRYKQHFADFLAENADAITGDVFLQCVCFGEVIYG